MFFDCLDMLAINARSLLSNLQFSVFQVEHRSLTLGEVLKGDRMAVAMYEIRFKG